MRLQADERGAGHAVNVQGTDGDAMADRCDRNRRHDGSGAPYVKYLYNCIDPFYK